MNCIQKKISKKTDETECANTAPPLMLQQWHSDASVGGCTYKSTDCAPKLESAVLRLNDSVNVAVVNMKPQELQSWMQTYEVEDLSSDEEADYETLDLQVQNDEQSLDVQEYELIDLDMGDLDLIVSNDAHSSRDHGFVLS